MKSFFQSLFEYNHHFNQKLYDQFNEHQYKTSKKSINLFNHILNAHHIWNNRIEHKITTFGTWDLHKLHDLKDMDQANYEQSLHILGKSNLDEMIRYSNSQGEAFVNPARDILFHVINHSTYHRGQIAVAFRQLGLEPLVTDYIFYKR
ncbi:MAG: damage-inducible protein DinB [Bacteroidota bacterium]|nr:damage-inducible protein DinB [Bacteroidota bacterium]